MTWLITKLSLFVKNKVLILANTDWLANEILCPKFKSVSLNVFALYEVRCNNTIFSSPMPDLTTTWTSPSSSSPQLQADTLACCSFSQKQVEVLLSSWLVMRCLDSTVPFCWPCWLLGRMLLTRGGRGGKTFKPPEIKQASDFTAASHCGK